MKRTDVKIGKVAPARIAGTLLSTSQAGGASIAVALILGGAFVLVEIAANAPNTGYRPSRAEILSQCEQIRDNALLDQCFDAADKAEE